MARRNSPNYADRVNVVKKVKIGWEWKFAALTRDERGRLRWDYVLVNGQPEQHTEGTYYNGFTSISGSGSFGG